MTEAPIWPDSLRIRDTGLHDDLGGPGQRIYTTAGRGYERQEYVRADLFDTLTAESDALRDRASELEADLQFMTENRNKWQDATTVARKQAETFKEGWRIADEGRIEAEAEVARLTAERDALRAALEPFAFLDAEMPQTTQEVWELIFKDRVRDWFAFGAIEAARAALNSSTPLDETAV